MPVRLTFLKLPFARPSMRRQYHRALERVLRSGKLILGPEVAAFEAEFAKFCAVPECVGVGNGTDALQIALRLSGVHPGAEQEVVTTPLTASFTAHAVVAAGAKPVFADISPGTLLIDPDAVSRSLTARTAALLPVHLYGQACDLDALHNLARKNRLALVQDAAQAHGTLYRSKPLAQVTDVACFSFYPTKNLGGLGDGGAIVTRSSTIAAAARLFRDGGRAKSHAAETEAINSRLDEIQAAFLRIHLKHLRLWNRRRAQCAELYDDLFAAAKIEEVSPVAHAQHSTSFPHLYVVRVGSTEAKALKSSRPALISFLARHGIDTGIHYEFPLHLQPAFRRFGYQRGDFPNAERACREVLSLPLHPFLKSAEIRRVVGVIAKFYKK